MKKFLQLFILGSSTSLLFPPFFLLPIGFISIPFFFVLLKKNLSDKKTIVIFLEGLTYGLGLNLFLFYWLKNPLLVEEETKNLFFLSYIYVLYSSLYFGIFAIIFKFFKNLNIQLIVFPIIFVSIEILRTKLFIAFPWNLFGYILSNNIFLIKNISYFGIYGLSYTVIILFLTPLLILNIINKHNTKFNIYYLSIILILFIFVFFLNFPKKEKIDSELNIDLVLYQKNIKQVDKWNLNLIEKRFNQLVTFISDNSKNKNKTLIVFSETEIPYILNDQDNLLKFLQSKLDSNTTLVIGGIRKSNDLYFNSLYKIDSNTINIFDKKKLVPFGEYIPLKEFFPFLNKLTYSVSDFSKGTTIRSINLFNEFNFIPTICYENIFFDEIIDENNIKNDLIINITNDAWFGNYQGPYQHFYQSILRAKEFNKYMIRVSNNGISAIIDPDGKVLLSTKLNEEVSVKYSLTIQQKSFPKSYSNKKNIYLFLYFLLILTFCFYYEKKLFNKK